MLPLFHTGVARDLVVDDVVSEPVECDNQVHQVARFLGRFEEHFVILWLVRLRLGLKRRFADLVFKDPAAVLVLLSRHLELVFLEFVSLGVVRHDLSLDVGHFLSDAAERFSDVGCLSFQNCVPRLLPLAVGGGAR